MALPEWLITIIMMTVATISMASGMASGHIRKNLQLTEIHVRVLEQEKCMTLKSVFC